MVKMKAYVDGCHNRPINLRKSWMHKHEAMKQFDQLRQDTCADSTTALLVVQSTNNTW